MVASQSPSEPDRGPSLRVLRDSDAPSSSARQSFEQASEPPAETRPLDAAPTNEQSLLAQCETIIQYCFRDQRLLTAALTHASGAQHRLASNERLEFLGDAILGVFVCEHLFHNYPSLLEGQLTKIKSAVVSRQTCAKISRAMGLESYLIVGKGISADKPVPPSLLADVFESLVAAIYLDGGAEEARVFVERYLVPEIMQAASGEADENFKSLLQQLVQRDLGDTPLYQLVEERGPDHDKWFYVAARFNRRDFPAAWGRNKKEAEQRAAGNALAELSGQSPPFLEPPAGIPAQPSHLPDLDPASGEFSTPHVVESAPVDASPPPTMEDPPLTDPVSTEKRVPPLTD
jgi:ribonuclease-3